MDAACCDMCASRRQVSGQVIISSCSRPSSNLNPPSPRLPPAPPTPPSRGGQRHDCIGTGLRPHSRLHHGAFRAHRTSQPLGPALIPLVVMVLPPLAQTNARAPAPSRPAPPPDHRQPAQPSARVSVGRVPRAVFAVRCVVSGPVCSREVCRCSGSRYGQVKSSISRS